jgi:hypothetical protein
MDSLLSSASILMAAIALIYSFYQKEISDAKEYKAPAYFVDAEPKYKEIKSLTYAKLLPLIIFTGVTNIVYLPPVISSISETFLLWFNPALASKYSPNIAALIIIELFLIYLLVFFYSIFVELVEKLKIIKKKCK